MRRTLGWGIQDALAYELRGRGRPYHGDPEGRADDSGWLRHQVALEDYVERCEIIRPEELCNADCLVVLREPRSALDFLEHVSVDCPRMQILREALRDVDTDDPTHRMTDRDVLERLAWRIAIGSLKVVVRFGTRPVGGSAVEALSLPAETAQPIRRRPTSTSATGEREARAPEADPLIPATLNAVAQGETLKDAARDGTPFCVVCAMLAASEAAAVPTGGR